MAKKWPKMAVFWPSRAEFCENQKKAWTFSYFCPERLYTKFQKIWLIRLGEKCVTDERTDWTEIIGPSGKIPGTNQSKSLSASANVVF